MGFWNSAKIELHKITAKCFNDYQSWFTQLDPCDEIVDITVKVRIRAFGRDVDKQEAWNRDWRSKHPDWGPAGAGVSVSSKIPEVWCDLKITHAGLTLPPHVLGHEMMHTLRLKDNQLINPDLLVASNTYTQGV